MSAARNPPFQAGEPMGRFLDYCTYGHMIDNVVLIVTGTLHERDVQVRGVAPPAPVRPRASHSAAVALLLCNICCCHGHAWQ